MPGQIAPLAADATLNLLAGSFSLAVQSTAPTYVPGLYWVDSGHSNALNMYNGTTWVNVVSRYLALLTANPATSGPGGGPAVLVSDLAECSDSGYARIPVAMTTASGTATPAVSSNTGLLTWGPFNVDMAAAVSWLALVTVQSGNTGLLVYTWSVPTNMTQQVDASEFIQCPTGGLVMSQS